MAYSAKAIANGFLKLAREQGCTIDPMKLQKLLYYAHAWNLALYDDPLIDEVVEAWPYGPVFASIYHEFKEFGSTTISRNALEFDDTRRGFDEPEIPPDDADAMALLGKVWEAYGHRSAITLSNMTHISGAPWDITRQTMPGLRNAPISNDLIRQYFAGLAANDDKKQAE